MSRRSPPTPTFACKQDDGCQPTTGPASLARAGRHDRSRRLRLPYVVPYIVVRKTSVYLSERESQRLAELARSEGRSQSEIIRDAITAYIPAGAGDDDFALAAGFHRIDADPRPISEIPDDELLNGFGQ